MRVRDLERLLTAQGVGAAKMDATTRKLRESRRLPTGGRGSNAPAIGPYEAAIVLLAVAGSSKATEANLRVEKLASLRSRKATAALVDVVASYLSDPKTLDEISEIRVARTRRRATVHFRDGQIEEYVTPKAGVRAERFYVEGILSGPLLELVARALHKGEAK